MDEPRLGPGDTSRLPGLAQVLARKPASDQIRPAWHVFESADVRVDWDPWKAILQYRTRTAIEFTEQACLVTSGFEPRLDPTDSSEQTDGPELSRLCNRLGDAAVSLRSVLVQWQLVLVPASVRGQVLSSSGVVGLSAVLSSVLQDSCETRPTTDLRLAGPGTDRNSPGQQGKPEVRASLIDRRWHSGRQALRKEDHPLRSDASGRNEPQQVDPRPEFSARAVSTIPSDFVLTCL